MEYNNNNNARSVHAYAVYFYQFSQPMSIVLLNCVECMQIAASLMPELVSGSMFSLLLLTDNAHSNILQSDNIELRGSPNTIEIIQVKCRI